jgi:hypothetical protein
VVVPVSVAGWWLATLWAVVLCRQLGLAVPVGGMSLRGGIASNGGMSHRVLLLAQASALSLSATAGYVSSVAVPRLRTVRIDTNSLDRRSPSDLGNSRQKTAIARRRHRQTQPYKSETPEFVNPTV